MESVILHAFRPHRLKCAEANVQGDLGNFDTAPANTLQDFRGEVQARGRRGHRSSRSGIDRLIAVTVGSPVVAIDVWRQRDVSDALHAGEEISNRMKSYPALPKIAARDDLRLQFGRVAEIDFLSDPDFPTRPYQALPLIRISASLPRQQHLDAPLQEVTRSRIMRAQRMRAFSAPPPIESCRKNARVVDNQ